MVSKTNDDRITFHHNDQIMEVDFSELAFDSAAQVNEFYDRVDEKIAATGQDKWYFLVNYKNCRLSPGAWIPFSNRGKKVNIASSLGSARFEVSDETGKSMLRQSEKEDFDPNLFSSRQAAFDHIDEMRDQAKLTEPEKVQKAEAQSPSRDINSRIIFYPDLETMEVDFSNFVFGKMADVNEFYDTIADKINETGRDWYFLVNYGATEIFPDAWYQWAIRSRRLNSAHSMGTVRFNPDNSARREIMKRAEANESDPNLFSSREEALARITQMRNDKVLNT